MTVTLTGRAVIQRLLLTWVGSAALIAREGMGEPVYFILGVVGGFLVTTAACVTDTKDGAP